MLQRIQTIYLFLVIVVNGILPFFIPLWTNGKSKIYLMFDQKYTAITGLILALVFISIISFKKRQHQFVLNRLSIFLNLILLGLFVYCSLNISGEALVVSEKGIGMFLPILAIVLLVLSNKAIQKDENLVKSVDRLR